MGMSALDTHYGVRLPAVELLSAGRPKQPEGVLRSQWQQEQQDRGRALQRGDAQHNVHQGGGGASPAQNATQWASSRPTPEPQLAGPLAQRTARDDAMAPGLEARINHNARSGRTVSDSFAARVVAQAAHSIARINTERRAAPSERAGLQNVFSYFFGDIFTGGEEDSPPDAVPQQQQQQQQQQQRLPQAAEVVRGHGSGFCVDESGVVVTNAHVVMGADRVTVELLDPTGPEANFTLEYEARVLGIDELLDIAVLKIDGPTPHHKFSALRLGDSSAVRVGDWAIAIGSPLGLNNSATLGIVSNLERTSGESGWDWMQQPLLQSDAAVNRGNSGGPLLDEAGAVMAVVSARLQGGEAIGFAVPINAVREVMGALLRGEHTPRPCVGCRMATVTADVGQPSTGALVEDVMPRSSAAAGGLLKGDVITHFAGGAVTDHTVVQRRVRRCECGSRVSAVVLRGGAEVKLEFTVSDIKAVLRALQKGGAGKPPRNTNNNGMVQTGYWSGGSPRRSF